MKWGKMKSIILMWGLGGISFFAAIWIGHGLAKALIILGVWSMATCGWLGYLKDRED